MYIEQVWRSMLRPSLHQFRSRSAAIRRPWGYSRWWFTEPCRMWGVVSSAHIVTGQCFDLLSSSLPSADSQQSFVSLSAYIDKLSSLFMAIGRTTPRYQSMALLYPQSKALQSFLAEYFIVAVNLCHHLFKFGQKSSVRQFTSSLSEAHLKTFQTDLEKWGNSIKEEMHLVEAQDNSKSRLLTREVFKSHSHQQGYASKIRVLDFCSKYDHETTWKQTRKVGNSSIHRQPAEYQEWKDCPYSCTLVYTGKLGSGKSVLLANIVDDLNLFTEKDESVVAYFFCKHDIRESLEVRTILGSITRQLLAAVSEFDVLAKRFENTYVKGDTEDLMRLLTEAFPKDRKAYIVLDGVDECDSNQKETLVNALWKMQERLQILVCISFREEPDNGLQSITNQLLDTRVVSLPENNPDIEAFIETELERCLQRELLTIGDPTLILEIQDTLLKGSQGMFLWVALQIRTLCEKKTDHAIREALADLPEDLSGTFARILHRSGNDLSLQAKTLHLVIAATRPLTTNELREALSVVPGDAAWDPSRLLHDTYSALACCGCLLAVDEEELTVRVVHHSFRQYLLAGREDTYRTRFSLQTAQRTMSDTIVTYLCYGVFGTELSKIKAHPGMTQSLPSKIVQATMYSSRNRRNLAIKFLKSRKQPTFDIGRAIIEMGTSSQSEKGNSFSFYQYASTHWDEFILCVSGNDVAIFRLSSNLIHLRASDFKVTRGGLWSLCEKAVVCGNEKILGLLLQVGNIDINSKDESGETILIRAVSQRYKALVELLLLDNIDINARDSWGNTALMNAASLGYEEMVEALLKTGKADVHAKSYSGVTALMKAVKGGHAGVVELILKSGPADLNVVFERWRTLLGHAAEMGYKDVVEVLLKTGEVDVHAEDRAGWTALMRAASNGQKDVVEILVRIGKTNVNKKSSSGDTALTKALGSGDQDMIKLLRSYGASVC